MEKEIGSMLKSKKLFLLDIDGTVALGEQLLPGAESFLRSVKQKGGEIRYLTNNSSKGVKDYLEQFHRWGISAEEEEFVTAGTYAIEFLKKRYPTQKILAVASDSYCKELRNAGLFITDHAGEDVGCLLTAYDTELTYGKLTQACHQLSCWPVPWYGTNPDIRCPVDFGMVPDCGSICRMIGAAVDREPKYIGKPEPEMVYFCMEQTGCTREETVIIGDRIYTDMECGKRAGVDTCLVLTGEGKAEEWKGSFRCSSLGAMAAYL